jgi:hypothetical protein
VRLRTVTQEQQDVTKKKARVPHVSRDGHLSALNHQLQIFGVPCVSAVDCQRQIHCTISVTESACTPDPSVAVTRMLP